MAETINLLTGKPESRRSPGVSASELASVPPDVKMTLRVRRRRPRHDGPRVLDQPARWRPSACTEDGLPLRSQAAAIAARASGRSGVVAFQSR